MSQPPPPGAQFPPPGHQPPSQQPVVNPYERTSAGPGAPVWPTGGAAPAPRPVLPRHVDGLSYAEVHQLGHGSWWRSLVGVFLVISIGLVTVPLMIGLGVMIWGIAVQGRGVEEASDWITTLLEGDPLTPLSLAVLLGSLAASIPVVFLAQRLLHGLGPG